MSKGFGKTIGRRIRIRQSDDASASCSGSSRLDPPSASSACTVRFTTPSTFNVISSPDPHCGSSGPRLPQSGKMPSQRHDAYTEVPVMVARGWTDAQKRAYVIADNQLALNAGWDRELLGLELGELKLGGFDLALTGF